MLLTKSWNRQSPAIVNELIFTNQPTINHASVRNIVRNWSQPHFKRRRRRWSIIFALDMNIFFSNLRIVLWRVRLTNELNTTKNRHSIVLQQVRLSVCLVRVVFVSGHSYRFVYNVVAVVSAMDASHETGLVQLKPHKTSHEHWLNSFNRKKKKITHICPSPS